MRLEPLEKELLRRMLEATRPSGSSDVDLDAVVVLDRSFSGSGFLTELGQSQRLKLFSADTSMRWGDVSARLNDQLEVRFVVYVDDGFVNGLEGSSYGENWPERIESFEFGPL